MKTGTQTSTSKKRKLETLENLENLEYSDSKRRKTQHISDDTQDDYSYWPDELVLSIFQQLPAHTLIKMREVSRQWNRLASSVLPSRVDELSPDEIDSICVNRDCAYFFLRDSRVSDKLALNEIWGIASRHCQFQNGLTIPKEFANYVKVPEQRRDPLIVRNYIMNEPEQMARLDGLDLALMCSGFHECAKYLLNNSEYVEKLKKIGLDWLALSDIKIAEDILRRSDLAFRLRSKDLFSICLRYPEIISTFLYCDFSFSDGKYKLVSNLSREDKKSLAQIIIDSTLLELFPKNEASTSEQTDLTSIDSEIVAATYLPAQNALSLPSRESEPEQENMAFNVVSSTLSRLRRFMGL